MGGLCYLIIFLVHDDIEMAYATILASLFCLPSPPVDSLISNSLQVLASFCWLKWEAPSLPPKNTITITLLKDWKDEVRFQRAREFLVTVVV